MPQNLHRTIRDACHTAVAADPGNAFDLSTELLSACAPWLAPSVARRLVAAMLCREPDPLRPLRAEPPR